MLKAGVSTSIGTRHQCITCMKECVIGTRHQCLSCEKEYINKRLELQYFCAEELRMKDYAANRKGGGAVPGLGFGNTTETTGGLFAAASTSPFSFGNTTQSKPPFGSTGGMTNRGGTQQTQNTESFGKSVGFCAPFTSTAPAFSFVDTNNTSLFRQNNQQKLEELEAKQEVENAKDDFIKLIGDELTCNICTEILIKPITLGCSHTFCKFCISEWKEQKRQCPVCRASIKTETPCLFLDNIICKTVEQLDLASVEKRLEIIKCREEEQKNR